jgi:hypothetical protein
MWRVSTPPVYAKITLSPFAAKLPRLTLLTTDAEVDGRP